MLQLPHAAAFLDPLFSSGMSVLTVAVDLIAERLLKAVAEDDFATERFQFVEDVVNTGFDHYDMIVSGAFDSFASYDTWNAWNRNWALGNMLGAFGPLSLLVRYLQSGDPSHLAKTTEPGRIGVLGSHLPNVVETMRGIAGRDRGRHPRRDHPRRGRPPDLRPARRAGLRAALHGLRQPRRRAPPRRSRCRPARATSPGTAATGPRRGRRTARSR